jgi:predicted nucleic-acid-binding protein
MIAVDTNILVRLLTADEARQYKKAYALLKTQDVFVPDTVILETEWVLRYGYGFAVDTICDALVKLFGLPNVHLANPRVVALAIGWHREGLDFADALHLANCQACEALYTFDKAFASRARGNSSCTVTLA